MLSDLCPLGLVDAAKRLDVEPFALVRLLVATTGVPKDLVFTQEQVDALREPGGIEPGWWEGVDLPEDTNPLRQRVRAALSLLLERGHVGGEGTRMDNLWRGLPHEDRALIREAVYALGDEGLLTVTATRVCARVSIAADVADRVRQIADGTSDTSALSALYEV